MTTITHRIETDPKLLKQIVRATGLLSDLTGIADDSGEGLVEVCKYLKRIAVALEHTKETVTYAVNKDSGTSSMVPETADCQSPVTADNGLASDTPPHKDPPPVAADPQAAGGGSPPSGWVSCESGSPPPSQRVVVWSPYTGAEIGYINHRLIWVSVEGGAIFPKYWIYKP